MFSDSVDDGARLRAIPGALSKVSDERISAVPGQTRGSNAAVCYVRSTAVRDIQSLATNVLNPPQPCGAYIDGHSHVVS
jgi:hypothetical protein